MADSLSTGPWKAISTGPTEPFPGDDWLIASLGTDHDGRNWYVVTDRVPASRAVSEPEADARAIVAWRNGLMQAEGTS